MGIIVCQSCNTTIDHFEDEKVTILYSNCCTCTDTKEEE
ncbi:GapA-binding peptide SR1P [Heyndrickxia acidicola]|uniref:GapA-binding peptide SR1P n=1 Tax=Heyndrickxia acidicola TaxID=209389 RepID=A0ABU6MJP6_9BACI|nr:GapA-binding peptide SR1P [Heyndrickxia acidicola]MED1204231.1 GapA-binding peptide SR1P [Heyndrickxia acidicola]